METTKHSRAVYRGYLQNAISSCDACRTQRTGVGAKLTPFKPRPLHMYTTPYSKMPHQEKHTPSSFSTRRAWSHTLANPERKTNYSLGIRKKRVTAKKTKNKKQPFYTCMYLLHKRDTGTGTHQSRYEKTSQPPSARLPTTRHDQQQQKKPPPVVPPGQDPARTPPLRRLVGRVCWAITSTTR